MPKKMTTEEFIERAKQVHGDKYDYSKVEYVGSKIKVSIICPVHGEFLQTPGCHLNGKGCHFCSNNKKLTTEEFIQKAKLVHGDKYDYSKVDYVNNTIKVTIICPIHGEFSQKPNGHLNGKGCHLCSNNKKLTTAEFIKRAKKVHGDKYDYSKVDYVNNTIKVTIICPVHGDFLQIPYDHLNGCGCLQCSGKNKKNTKTFIEQSKKVHGNTYNYHKVDYINSHKKIKIICKKHGEFSQNPYDHLNGHGCPICNESRGEREVSKWLENNNIKYEREKRFKNCKNKIPLPFDFYLPELNILIEYDGEQHFKPFYRIKNTENALMKLKKTQHNDKIKNDYCSLNNIPLLRIKYTESVDKRLSSILKVI